MATPQTSTSLSPELDDAIGAAVREGINAALNDAFGAKGQSPTIDPTVQHFSEMIESQLDDSEELVDCCHAYTRPHFLIRILPLVPDLLTRPKKYLLVCTTKRVLILTLTNPFNKFALPEFKGVSASIARDQMKSAEFKRTMFSTFVTIRSASGQAHKLKCHSESSAREFAETARALMARANS